MASTYIGQIIEHVNRVTDACGPVLLFGENIDTGSRISGLARGLTVNPAGRIVNVGNCELTHMGLGFGMMLDGGRAVVFMKQLDFLLLGLDQIVNTFNFIRAFRPADGIGSFTIVLIVCDQGYQGVQSSLNGVGDVASLANVRAYCLNAAADAARVVADQLVAPGFRILCTSQRLFGMPPLEVTLEASGPDGAWFQYRAGTAMTIVCHNFALRDGLAIADRLSAEGVESDVFHVNFVPGLDTSALLDSCVRTGALILCDDSKTVTKFGDGLVTQLQSSGAGVDVLSLTRRGCSDEAYGACEDRVEPDFARVLAFARRPRSTSCRVVP